MGNPFIEIEDGKWWFWDEAGLSRMGPFESYEEAEQNMKDYDDIVLRGKKKFLCYWELHVDDRTFYIHTVVVASGVEEALNRMKSDHGESYHLQVKGCLGEFTGSYTAFKFMRLENLQPLGAIPDAGK